MFPSRPFSGEEISGTEKLLENISNKFPAAQIFCKFQLGILSESFTRRISREFKWNWSGDRHVFSKKPLLCIYNSVVTELS